MRNIIIIMAICLFFNSGCFHQKEKVKVEYDITTYSGSDSISVKMRVQSTCNNLILFSPVQDNAMGLKKLSITDENGTPLKFIQKTSSVKALNRVFNFTSYKVQHSNKQEMFINYQCKVGLPETEVTSGYAEVTYGSAAKDFVAFSLRNVLLCPNPKTENITFRFYIPDNHQLLTSWGAIDTVANYHFNEPIEKIIDIPVVVMKSFKKLSFEEESHISFYAPPSVKIDMNKDIEKLLNLYNFYDRTIGLQQQYYSFILLPEKRQYQRCYIKPTPILQVLSVPLTSIHIKQAAEGIVKPNLMSTSLRNLAAGCSEEWLLTSLNHYYTFKHHQIMGNWEDQLNKIFPTYANNISMGTSDLIEQFDQKIHRPLHPLNFQVKSIFILNLLDNLLRDEFHISNGLDHVIKETIKHKRKNGFISHHVKELIGKRRFDSFINEYARGKKFVEFDLPESIEHVVDIPMGITYSLKNQAIEDSIIIYSTFNTDGFLETCGCITSQAGGIDRKMTYLTDLKDKGKQFILLDLGNAIGIEKKSPILSETLLAEGNFMVKMLPYIGYHAVVAGKNEIWYGDKLFSSRAQKANLTYLSVNLEHERLAFLSTHKLLQIGRYKIALLGYTGLKAENVKSSYIFDQNKTHLLNPEFMVDLTNLVKQLKQQVDLIILAGEVDDALLKEIIEHKIDIDFIVGYGKAQQNCFLVHRDSHQTNLPILTSNLSLYGMTKHTIFLNANQELSGIRNDAILLNEEIPSHKEMNSILLISIKSLPKRIRQFPVKYQFLAISKSSKQIVLLA